MVKKWAAEFKCGKESLEADPRPRRPVTVTTLETIDKIHDIIIVAIGVLHCHWVGYLPGLHPCSHPQRTSYVHLVSMVCLKTPWTWFETFPLNASSEICHWLIPRSNTFSQALPRRWSHSHQSLLCWSSETATEETQTDSPWTIVSRSPISLGQCTG